MNKDEIHARWCARNRTGGFLDECDCYIRHAQIKPQMQKDRSTMTDFRKMADGYSAAFGDTEGERYESRRKAYLAGVNAALEAAAQAIKDDADKIMQNYVMTGPAGIVRGCIGSVNTLKVE